jgi:hypothetical protein
MWSSNSGRGTICASCGSPISSSHSGYSTPAPPPPAAPIIVVESKSAGLLAFKVFLTVLVVALIFSVATSGEDAATQATGKCSRLEAALHTSSRISKSGNENRNVVRSQTAAWVVAGFLVLLCFGSL